MFIWQHMSKNKLAQIACKARDLFCLKVAQLIVFTLKEVVHPNFLLMTMSSQTYAFLSSL